MKASIIVNVNNIHFISFPSVDLVDLSHLLLAVDSSDPNTLATNLLLRGNAYSPKLLGPYNSLVPDFLVKLITGSLRTTVHVTGKQGTFTMNSISDFKTWVFSLGNKYQQYNKKIVQFNYTGGTENGLRTVKIEKVIPQPYTKDVYYLEGYDLHKDNLTLPDAYRRYLTSRISGDIKVLA